jgi:sugar transferase (PEP-CTERM/EpsH1 system associated)
MRPRESGESNARGPVRVVHVVTTLAIGGLEKVVLDLVRFATPDQFSLRVVCLDQAGVLEEQFARLGVPVDVIGTAGSVPVRILRLARYLRRVRPNVVHTHNPQAHLHGAIAARLARVPAVVHTKHGREYMERPALAWASRLASGWTSRFVAVSMDAASVAREIEGVPAGNVHVIHNGIDPDLFAVRPPRPALTPRRAVIVGRLSPVKDHATLLRAARRVVDATPTFELDIVGDGPLRVELEALRDLLGLRDRVHFHGYHADVSAFLAAADFFVLSSVSEGVSIALLEAMASGLPTVATDVGGNREVVVSGETGYLVPSRAHDVLAAVMLRIQSDDASLERMGRAARRRVGEHFNLRKVVQEYERLYLECLAPTRAGTAMVPPAVPVKSIGGQP